MTEQDRNRQREHWQAIAEQLGLSVDEGTAPQEDTPESAPAARSDQLSDEPTRESEEIPSSRADATDWIEHAESVPEWTEPEPIAADTLEERSGSEQPAEEETFRPAEPQRVREQPQRGRRRGRSRSAAEADAADPDSATVGVSAQTQAEEPGEGRSRRGRGRAGGRKGSASKQAPDAVPEEKSATADLPLEEDDADNADFSNATTWTVPSWEELIASLYRPER